MIVVSYAINEAKSYENGHRFDRRDEVNMDYALEFSHFVNTLGPRLCSREINVIHSLRCAPGFWLGHFSLSFFSVTRLVFKVT